MIHHLFFDHVYGFWRSECFPYLLLVGRMSEEWFEPPSKSGTCLFLWRIILALEVCGLRCNSHKDKRSFIENIKYFFLWINCRKKWYCVCIRLLGRKWHFSSKTKVPIKSSHDWEQSNEKWERKTNRYSINRKPFWGISRWHQIQL